MAGIMEAIKKGFGAATKGIGLVLVMIIFNLVWNLASIPLNVNPDQTPTPQLTMAVVIFSLLFILTSIFIQGGALASIRDYIKEGKIRLASFASYGMKYYLRLLGVGILIVLIIAIVALIAGLIVAATAPLNNVMATNIAVVIAIAIGVVAGLLYFVPLALAPYALVTEELGVIESMKRSVRVARPLTKILLIVVLFIILILISVAIALIVGFLAGLAIAAMPATAGKILMAVVTSIINGYLGIVMMGSFMTYYLTLSRAK
jgi:hypothetical protein